MIIDFHTHMFPDSMANKTVATLAGNAKITPFSDGTVGGIRQSMKESGIDKSVLLQIATKPSQTQTVNNWAAQVNSDEIIGFGSIHPDYENWEEELERVKSLGLKGIKLHPDYQKFFVDDKRMIPIYRKLNELELITVFHAGIDLGMYPPVYCTPMETKSILKYFNKTPLVLAHMGACMMWDGVERHLVGEDVYFDTSFSYKNMPKEQMKRIIEKHGSDKILFATDSPWGRQREEIENIRSLELDEGELAKIFGGNAGRLLGLLY